MPVEVRSKAEATLFAALDRTPAVEFVVPGPIVGDEREHSVAAAVTGGYFDLRGGRGKATPVTGKVEYGHVTEPDGGMPGFHVISGDNDQCFGAQTVGGGGVIVGSDEIFSTDVNALLAVAGDAFTAHEEGALPAADIAPKNAAGVKIELQVFGEKDLPLVFEAHISFDLGNTGFLIQRAVLGGQRRPAVF